jgi:hypothetical protein
MSNALEFENYFISFLSTRSTFISEIQKEIENECEISLTTLELIYDILYANSKNDATKNLIIRKNDFWNCLVLLDFPVTKIKNYKVNDILTLHDAVIIAIVLLNRN